MSIPAWEPDDETVEQCRLAAVGRWLPPSAAWLDFVDDVWPTLSKVCTGASRGDVGRDLQADLRKWAASIRERSVVSSPRYSREDVAELVAAARDMVPYAETWGNARPATAEDARVLGNLRNVRVARLRAALIRFTEVPSE